MQSRCAINEVRQEANVEKYNTDKRRANFSMEWSAVGTQHRYVDREKRIKGRVRGGMKGPKRKGGEGE